MLDIVKDNDYIYNQIKLYKETDDIRIRNKIVERCFNCLRIYARYFKRSYKVFDIEDYEMMMVETLIYIIDNYDITKDNMIRTYFHIRAKGAILDRIRKVYGRNNNKVSLHSLNTIKSYDYDEEYINYIIDETQNIEEEYIKKEEQEELISKKNNLMKDIYNKLKKSKTKIIFLEYFFNNKSKKEIAKQINESEKFIHNIVTYIKKKHLNMIVKNRKQDRENTLPKIDIYLQLAKDDIDIKMIKLYYLENNSMIKVSEIMNISQNTLYRRLNKIKKLYNHLKLS